MAHFLLFTRILLSGPFRMRKKMLKNDLFYVHYPYRPDMENNVSLCSWWLLCCQGYIQDLRRSLTILECSDYKLWFLKLILCLMSLLHCLENTSLQCICLPVCISVCSFKQSCVTRLKFNSDTDSCVKGVKSLAHVIRTVTSTRIFML